MNSVEEIINTKALDIEEIYYIFRKKLVPISYFNHL
jgi:hypothetical protein